MVVIIVGRELAITGLRSIAARQGLTIDASELGKIKMVSQVLAVTLIILSNLVFWLKPLSLAALWLTVIFALASAVDYFRKFWKAVGIRGQASRGEKPVLLKKSRSDVPTQ